MNASPATTLAQDTDDASEFDRLPARVKLLDAIFTIAARHDKVCQMYDRAAVERHVIDPAPRRGIDPPRRSSARDGCFQFFFGDITSAARSGRRCGR